MEYIRQFHEIRELLKEADHVDVKVVEGRVTLRKFIASMLSYYPWWIVMLYRIRAVFVRLLGIREEENFGELPRLEEADISLTPGETAIFFTVYKAEENQFWIAETPEERHLRAYFGIFAEDIRDDLKRFHVITIVHYKDWTGPVYFNTIRPFHHIVVSRMAQAGIS